MSSNAVFSWVWPQIDGARLLVIVALSESLNILHILASKCIACKLLIKAMTNENGAAAAQKNELP
jgi:hypothetical protein